MSASRARANDLLAGQTALITGAGRGIGSGIAESLCQAGARVAINARSDRFARPLADELSDRYDAQVIVVVGDMTQPDEVNRVVETVLRQLGPIHILVNALGDAIRGQTAVTPLSDSDSVMTPLGILQTLEINLLSAIYTSREVVPSMIEYGEGTIINIAGTAALRGGTGLAAYTAAKSGLAGLTRALALEWAPHRIRVNAISPGFVPDPRHPGMHSHKFLSVQAAAVPLQRLATPGDIGTLARFLASKYASMITGQTITLDGGASL